MQGFAGFGLRNEVRVCNVDSQMISALGTVGSCNGYPRMLDVPICIHWIFDSGRVNLWLFSLLYKQFRSVQTPEIASACWSNVRTRLPHMTHVMIIEVQHSISQWSIKKRASPADLGMTPWYNDPNSHQIWSEKHKWLVCVVWKPCLFAHVIYQVYTVHYTSAVYPFFCWLNPY